jgi:hypothetical protein
MVEFVMLSVLRLVKTRVPEQTVRFNLRAPLRMAPVKVFVPEPALVSVEVALVLPLVMVKPESRPAMDWL